MAMGAGDNVTDSDGGEQLLGNGLGVAEESCGALADGGDGG